MVYYEKNTCYPNVMDLYCFCFLIGFSLCAHAEKKNVSNQSKRSLIGIIVPLPEESMLLRRNINHIKEESIDGITYYTGTINHKNVVFVNSGLGKVNSAIIAARLIRDFHPNMILMSGSSGSIDIHLKKFDVIVGKEVVNVDLGELTKQGPRFKFNDQLYNPQSHAFLPITFNLNSRLIKLIDKSNTKRAKKIMFGKIATSDVLPNTPAQVSLLRQGGFDVIEMEGASLMQACWLLKTPCIVIRGISNDTSESIAKADITVAANKAASVLMEILSSYA